MPDYIGWLATATFASSYFSKHPARLRRIQALAALLWMSYGVLIHAVPIIVANLIVAGGGGVLLCPAGAGGGAGARPPHGAGRGHGGGFCRRSHPAHEEHQARAAPGRRL